MHATLTMKMQSSKVTPPVLLFAALCGKGLSEDTVPAISRDSACWLDTEQTWAINLATCPQRATHHPCDIMCSAHQTARLNVSPDPAFEKHGGNYGLRNVYKCTCLSPFSSPDFNCRHHYKDITITRVLPIDEKKSLFQSLQVKFTHFRLRNHDFLSAYCYPTQSQVPS
jgi:hypothetical protein